ncbi:multicopper oxidase family protein [Streptacidiphilus melanogenes]|uniref:multicopper oxidase family protein n=1 Tax=Streptacidiphilus melanogenes TaxID=411235 RepID=UPI000A8417CC|nr:multicopper oxidase family protein [Streptacidiphilus melanogenes]
MRFASDKTSRPLLRRTALALAAVLVAVAGGTGAGSAVAASQPVPTTAEQEKGMTAGGPLRDPVDADASGRHRVRITLDAHRTRFDISGRGVVGQSYDGRYIAPTLRMEPGSTVVIQLVNHLGVATNLHVHGMHVYPAGQADDPFRCVPAGATATYLLRIPRGQQQGTYWYHSHAMGRTCPFRSAGGPDMTPPMVGDVENQIFAGLSGAIVVGDDRSLLPATLRHITAHTLVLKDMQIDRKGHIVQNTATTAINSDSPTVRLVDGQLRPVLSMRPDETQLWRIVNAGADIFYQLRLDGYRFTVVGEDGAPVARVTTATNLLMPPGKRFDVLVTACPRPGRAWLRTLAYSTGPQGDSYPQSRLLRLDVRGPRAARLPRVTGRIPTAAPDLRGAPIARHRTVVLSESADGNTFYINGRQFSGDDPSVFATPARLGTVEEWTVVNASREIHPFHLHVSYFQVMSVNGRPQPYAHVQDTVPIPYASHGRPGVVVVRIAFTDFPGRYLFHCHIGAHEDNGMMSFVNVVR